MTGMKHLTKREIIEFLTMSDTDAAHLAMARRVNAHLASCGACRRRAAALQDMLAALEEEAQQDSLCAEAVTEQLEYRGEDVR